MAELPNAPVKPKPTGPVFHKDVVKVRVTSGGALNTTEFDGKVYSREGEPVSASELGWDHDALAVAEADPTVVIEQYNKNGQLIKKDGTPYPSTADLTPKAAPKKGD